MDYLLIAFVVLYFLKGFWRGLLNVIVSLFATVLVFVLAYKFCQPLGEYFQELNFVDFQSSISGFLDQMFVGKFASNEELIAAISSENKVFVFFLSKLLKNISFDGILTAGQILSPTINALIFKVIAFIVTYVILSIGVSLMKTILLKVLKICKLEKINRLLGGVVGAVKGAVLFLIVYVVLLGCANFFLNEALLTFCRSGVVSNFLYENLIEKIINLFY